VKSNPTHRESLVVDSEAVLISGNHACAEGALAAGCRSPLFHACSFAVSDISRCNVSIFLSIYMSVDPTIDHGADYIIYA
jgi:hypothetical protein